MITIPLTQNDKNVKWYAHYYKIIQIFNVFIPNSDSRAFFSMGVKFRSSSQALYESKLNSLAVILFPIDNDNIGM